MHPTNCDHHETCAECERCAEHGCECASEPAPTSALGFEGECEHCQRLVAVDEMILVYGDEIVTHVKCPMPRAMA